VSDIRKLFNIKNINGRIGNSLTENTLGIGTDKLMKLFLTDIIVNESTLYAHLLHRNTEQIVGAAVDRRRGDEVITAFTDIEKSEKVCSLSGAAGREVLSGNERAGHPCPLSEGAAPETVCPDHRRDEAADGDPDPRDGNAFENGGGDTCVKQKSNATPAKPKSA
jgi:hypothetical protein